jgi:hypothetical protein
MLRAQQLNIEDMNVQKQSEDGFSIEGIEKLTNGWEKE